MSTTTPKVNLWLSFGDVGYRLALSIPLDKCGTFAVNPLKWLRFLGFAIYGREGYLSTSKAGPEIDDYTTDIKARSYYFVSEGEACLVDVDTVEDRTSDASDLTTRRKDFRTNIIERDGTCVITGDIDEYCIACHILPHVKGSSVRIFYRDLLTLIKYISNVVRHRGETYDSANDINDINDTRNGLLLLSILHRPFGAGKLAFLKTPNFALTVDDIPYHSTKEADEESPASRLTLHYFVELPLLGITIPKIAPHNSDARQPQDTSEWPPAIIVDLFYAVAAIIAWSPKPFVKYVREQSWDAYYNDDDNGDNDNASDSSHVDVLMGDQTTGQSGSGRYALRGRNKTSNIPPKERRLADLMDGISALWLRSSRVGKPKPEDVHASSLARNEGVKMWLQSLEGPATN